MNLALRLCTTLNNFGRLFLLVPLLTCSSCEDTADPCDPGPGFLESSERAACATNCVAVQGRVFNEKSGCWPREDDSSIVSCVSPTSNFKTWLCHVNEKIGPVLVNSYRLDELQGWRPCGPSDEFSRAETCPRE